MAGRTRRGRAGPPAPAGPARGRFLLRRNRKMRRNRGRAGPPTAAAGIRPWPPRFRTRRVRTYNRPAAAPGRSPIGREVRNYDLEFLKRFSMVLGMLALITLGLILLASHLHGRIPPEVSPSAAARTQERIAPVGAVYAGDTGAAAQAAAAEAAAAAAASQVAYGATTDGSVIFQNLCGACHSGGVGGAPTLSQGAWASRIAQGKDTLYKHAIEGFTGSAGVMPPKGGNPALTDEQVQATVDWMLDNLK